MEFSAAKVQHSKGFQSDNSRVRTTSGEPLVNQPSTAAHVYIVEDEEVLRNELCFVLSRSGFSVEGVATATELYRRLAVKNAAVIVLDIGLDGEDGLSICKYLRGHDPSLGIVFLTARGLRDDRITGLVAGADAYLVKPVEIQEIVLVIERLMARRDYMGRPSAEAGNVDNVVALSAPAEVPAAGGVAAQVPAAADASCWNLDVAFGQLRAPNGHICSLSDVERKLVFCLMSEKGQPVSSEQLAHKLNIPIESYQRHRVEVIISRLRKSVEQAVGLKLPLFSVRGVGYFVRDIVTT
ncbi:response regulator transcription factor [Ideonella paludis]|uniref:Response regulator transcription factor n=1 Tax=Ideonella paludis TaxID=1233411 RepID=A0ABS5DTT3_9BURK|nr:response regulator transcription factor [Ideonella paludis]